MADNKKKKSTTVRTRVVEASDTTAPAKKKTSKKAIARATAKSNATRSNAKKVGYFKGAWLELKQVRWPNRRATWSLTFAIIIFTLLFTALILLLDAGFKYLFDFIIK